MSGTEALLHHAGCYKCGRWPVQFGGFVSPAIPGVARRFARWWTKCRDCGYVEVTETGE